MTDKDAPPAVEPEIVEPTTQQLAKRIEKADPVFGLNLMEFSKLAYQSGYFPSVKSLSQCAIKIALGRDMGLGATQALRNIYVVVSRDGDQVSIGVKGEQMAAAIRTSGRYDYKIVKATEEEAEIDFLRVDKRGKTEVLGRSRFTIAEAKRAGLVDKGFGWKNYPEDMLVWRAMSRGQRRFAPDIFGGHVVYDAEELKEFSTGEPKPVEFTEIPAPLVALVGALGWTRGQIEMALGDFKRRGLTEAEQVAELTAEVEKKRRPAASAVEPTTAHEPDSPKAQGTRESAPAGATPERAQASTANEPANQGASGVDPPAAPPEQATLLTGW